MTAWSDHVKKYAKKHKMSYQQANKNTECKEAYQKKKKISPSRILSGSPKRRAKLARRKREAREAEAREARRRYEKSKAREARIGRKQEERDKEEFFQFMRENNIKAIKKLLKKGFDVNQFIDGTTPIHYTLLIGKFDIVKVLLEAGANVNLEDNEGETPIYTAAWSEHLETVKLLIESGANVNHENNKGETVLSQIVFYNNLTKTVKLLIDSRADVNHVDNDGQTPLFPRYWWL